MVDEFRFKKKYGQNFLKDENIVDKIARNVVLPNSLVIEVGPGSGMLTRKLAHYATHVICFEIDTDLQNILTINLRDCNNVTVYYEDFLKVDLQKYLKNYVYENLYFVSNVPYYITTPILMKLMQCRILFSNIVMMVQKEVGNRFCALPGTREYGSISVYLNYFFEVQKLFEVSRKSFVPVPNVDSVVVSFLPKKNLLEVKNLEFFFQLVRDSFQFKRKTLRNNLRKYDLTKIESVLMKYDLTLEVRAEALDFYIFVEISNSLC